MNVKTKSILLLEDDLVQAMLFASAAQGVIGNVSNYSAVDDAISKMRQTRFDICVVDLAVFTDFRSFDDQGGLSFITEVREKVSKTVPIIVATGSRDPAFLIPSFKVGADDFVLKSEGMPHLIKRVKHWLSGPELNESAMAKRRQEIIQVLQKMHRSHAALT